MQTLTIKLLSIKDLKPHEKISKINYTEVLQDILKEQIIFNPIFVDMTTKVILDGHHRFTVAKKLNLSQIPCLVIDYFNDSIISVFPRRDNIPVNKNLVIQAGLQGNLFPNKSTRHVLHISYSAIPYALTDLSLHPTTNTRRSMKLSTFDRQILHR